MQSLQQLYDTAVRPLPVTDQLEFASLILDQLASAQRKREQQMPSMPMSESVEMSTLPHRSLREIMQSAPGQQLFKTAEDVDSYLRAERDSWER